MYIVGIDIGKNHHEASIVSPEGKQIGRSLRFATTHKGADSLMSFIFKNIGNSPCVFGMEATGHYWYPIYSFLKQRIYHLCNQSYPVWFFKKNVYTTNQKRFNWLFFNCRSDTFRSVWDYFPWLMKNILAMRQFMSLSWFCHFFQNWKLSSESAQLWNKSSQSTKNSFPLYGSAHPWAFLKSTSPLRTFRTPP